MTGIFCVFDVNSAIFSVINVARIRSTYDENVKHQYRMFSANFDDDPM